MELLKDKTDQELHNALMAEIAKSRNEISSATNDIKKASGRLSFLIAVVNELIDRKIDQQEKD